MSELRDQGDDLSVSPFTRRTDDGQQPCNKQVSAQSALLFFEYEQGAGKTGKMKAVTGVRTRPRATQVSPLLDRNLGLLSVTFTEGRISFRAGVLGWVYFAFQWVTCFDEKRIHQKKR